MSMEFDFSGFERMLGETQKRLISAAEKGVGDAVDALLGDSRDEAPLKTGTLRATAGKEVEVSGSTITGTVAYSVTELSESGERVEYALRLHELGEYKNPTTAGTRPKFLERPLKVNAERYKRMIADTIRKELS